MSFSRGNQKKSNCPQLSPQLSIDQIAVIAALLTNALQVQSVLVDRNQLVQVLLVGPLCKKKQVNNLLEQIRELPIADFLDNLKKVYQ